MADVPETKPCDHSDCGGTMHLKTGADPTMQGTSQGRQSGTVLISVTGTWTTCT